MLFKTAAAIKMVNETNWLYLRLNIIKAKFQILSDMPFLLWFLNPSPPKYIKNKYNQKCFFIVYLRYHWFNYGFSSTKYFNVHDFFFPKHHLKSKSNFKKKNLSNRPRWNTNWISSQKRFSCYFYLGFYIEERKKTMASQKIKNE